MTSYAGIQGRDAVIVGAVRTPIGKGKASGALHDVLPVDLLAHSLRRAGMLVVTAREVAAAVDLLERTQPDLVVVGLDITTPAGREVLQAITRRSQAQVILLGSVNGDEHVIRALDLGADDYLVKPFSFAELLARIRARLRRGAMQPASPFSSPPMLLHADGLTLDRARRTATYEDRPLRLTPTEFRVLEYLLVHRGVVVPTRTLLEGIWGCEQAVGPDVVRVTVFRVQHKLSEAGGRHLLTTVRGVGFIVRAEEN